MVGTASSESDNEYQILEVELPELPAEKKERTKTLIDTGMHGHHLIIGTPC